MGMDKKSPSVSPAFSVREFFARFPNEQACLEHIMAVRFGLRSEDVERAAPQSSG
jgi:hypothetical protein